LITFFTNNIIGFIFEYFCTKFETLKNINKSKWWYQKMGQTSQLFTKKLLIMKKETNKKVRMQCKSRYSLKHLGKRKHVPWLTISGNWLAKIGFNIGSCVEIIAGENQLIIKKA